jgi:hypothetical protein
MPTTFMPVPDLRQTVPGRAALPTEVAPGRVPPPAPAASVPLRRMTLRQRLVGQRSIIFIAIMLARMVWLLVQGIRTGQDLRFAAAGAGIYVMALFIASPARRFRSISVGIMCGLIWSYAFVDPSQLGSPAISAWPAVFPIGVLAVLVEIIFTDVIRAHRGKFGGQAGRLAASLPRPAIFLQVFAVALFVIPIVVMCVEGTLAYGFDSEPLEDLVLVSISLPPLIGMFVYVSFVLRRLRSLAPRTVKA